MGPAPDILRLTLGIRIQWFGNVMFLVFGISATVIIVPHQTGSHMALVREY